MLALRCFARRTHFSRLASAWRKMASIWSARERVTVLKRPDRRELATNSFRACGGGLDGAQSRSGRGRAKIAAGSSFQTAGWTSM
jgi:hypothetical protein